MVKGPCMCGDPYCGSCGDPSLADLEAAEERLMDMLNDTLRCNIYEYEYLLTIIPTLIEQFRTLCNSMIRDAMVDDQHYIDYLKGEIERFNKEYRDISYKDEEIARLKDRIFELTGEVTDDIKD